MNFKESKFKIVHDDIFGTTSRWALFWNVVIKKAPYVLSISLNPPETEVNIDYIKFEGGEDERNSD